MASTIYLKRGQNLNITVAFQDEDGSAITLDGTWTVTSGMRAKGTCGTPIDLPCVVAAGVATIEYATDDLEYPSYDIDIIAENGDDRDITDVFHLQLGNTITPLT